MNQILFTRLDKIERSLEQLTSEVRKSAPCKRLAHQDEGEPQKWFKPQDTIRDQNLVRRSPASRRTDSFRLERDRPLFNSSPVLGSPNLLGRIKPGPKHSPRPVWEENSMPAFACQPFRRDSALQQTEPLREPMDSRNNQSPFASKQHRDRNPFFSRFPVGKSPIGVPDDSGKPTVTGGSLWPSIFTNAHAGVEPSEASTDTGPFPSKPQFRVHCSPGQGSAMGSSIVGDRQTMDNATSNPRSNNLFDAGAFADIGDSDFHQPAKSLLDIDARPETSRFPTLSPFATEEPFKAGQAQIGSGKAIDGLSGSLARARTVPSRITGARLHQPFDPASEAFHAPGVQLPQSCWQNRHGVQLDHTQSYSFTPYHGDTGGDQQSHDWSARPLKPEPQRSSATSVSGPQPVSLCCSSASRQQSQETPTILPSSFKDVKSPFGRRQDRHKAKHHQMLSAQNVQEMDARMARLDVERWSPTLNINERPSVVSPLEQSSSRQQPDCQSFLTGDRQGQSSLNGIDGQSVGSSELTQASFTSADATNSPHLPSSPIQSLVLPPSLPSQPAKELLNRARQKWECVRELCASGYKDTPALHMIAEVCNGDFSQAKAMADEDQRASQAHQDSRSNGRFQEQGWRDAPRSDKGWECVERLKDMGYGRTHDPDDLYWLACDLDCEIERVVEWLETE